MFRMRIATVLLLTTLFAVCQTLASKKACKDAKREGALCKMWADLGACVKNKEVMQMYCQQTCGCRAPAPAIPEITECASSKFGCCWDNRTTIVDNSKINCPPCKNLQSEEFCEMWKGDCNSKIPQQGYFMRSRCPVTCGVPCEYSLHVKECRDHPAHKKDCDMWFYEDKCYTESEKMKVFCPRTCGFCDPTSKIISEGDVVARN